MSLMGSVISKESCHWTIELFVPNRRSGAIHIYTSFSKAVCCARYPIKSYIAAINRSEHVFK
jgi:hypothetical protein